MILRNFGFQEVETEKKKLLDQAREAFDRVVGGKIASDDRGLQREIVYLQSEAADLLVVFERANAQHIESLLNNEVRVHKETKKSSSVGEIIPKKNFKMRSGSVGNVGGGDLG